MKIHEEIRRPLVTEKSTLAREEENIVTFAVYPRASSIDTPLPTAPVATHLMTEFKAPWVPLHLGAEDKLFRHYPDEWIADWHARLNAIMPVGF